MKRALPGIDLNGDLQYVGPEHEGGRARNLRLNVEDVSTKHSPAFGLTVDDITFHNYTTAQIKDGKDKNMYKYKYPEGANTVEQGIPGTEAESDPMKTLERARKLKKELTVNNVEDKNANAVNDSNANAKGKKEKKEKQKQEAKGREENETTEKEKKGKAEDKKKKEAKGREEEKETKDKEKKGKAEDKKKKEAKGREEEKETKDKQKKGTKGKKKKASSASESEGSIDPADKKKKKKKKSIDSVKSDTETTGSEAETDKKGFKKTRKGSKKGKGRRHSDTEKTLGEEQKKEERPKDSSGLDVADELAFMKDAKFSLQGDHSEINRPPFDIPQPVILGRTVDVDLILQAAEGYVGPLTPEWSKSQAEAAPFMILDNGAPYTFPVAPNLKGMDESVLGGVLSQFSAMAIERVHHYALNGEFLFALFRGKHLVDVLVHVEDRLFYAHRCVLCAHSSYFTSVLVDNGIPPYTVTDITLNAIDPDLFRRFLNFAYSGDIEITLGSVQALKRLAQMLKSSTLKAKILIFMSKTQMISLQEAMDILVQHKDVDEKPIAIEVVKNNFMTVLQEIQGLCHFTLDDFLDIISSNNLCVNSELDVFWAVLFWVASNRGNRTNFLNRLMSEVRFTRMSTLELLDCAKVSDLVKLSKECRKYLLSANWVCHARELGLEDPLELPEHQKRYSLVGSPAYEPSVAEFDKRFLTYKTLMQQESDSLVFPMEKEFVSPEKKVTFQDDKDPSADRNERPSVEAPEADAQQEEQKGESEDAQGGPQEDEQAQEDVEKDKPPIENKKKKKKRKKSKSKGHHGSTPAEEGGNSNENKNKTEEEPEVSLDGAGGERATEDNGSVQIRLSMLLEKCRNFFKNPKQVNDANTSNTSVLDGLGSNFRQNQASAAFPYTASHEVTNMTYTEKEHNRCTDRQHLSLDIPLETKQCSPLPGNTTQKDYPWWPSENYPCSDKLNLDPIQLWESSTSHSPEVCLLKGNILQPFRINKIHLKRSQMDEEPTDAELCCDKCKTIGSNEKSRLSEMTSKVPVSRLRMRSPLQPGNTNQSVSGDNNLRVKPTESYQCTTEISSISHSIVYQCRNSSDIDSVSGTETTISVAYTSGTDGWSSHGEPSKGDDLMTFDDSID